jgi:hypothetical protein
MLARAADGPDFVPSRNGRGRLAAAAHGLRARARAMARRRGQLAAPWVCGHTGACTHVGAGGRRARFCSIEKRTREARGGRARSESACATCGRLFLTIRGCKPTQYRSESAGAVRYPQTQKVPRRSASELSCERTCASLDPTAVPRQVGLSFSMLRLLRPSAPMAYRWPTVARHLAAAHEYRACDLRGVTREIIHGGACPPSSDQDGSRRTKTPLKTEG